MPTIESPVVGIAPAYAAVSLAIKATPGTLYAINAVNRNAAARYLQIFNTATVGAGAVPVVQFLVPPLLDKSVTRETLGASGIYFTNATGFCAGMSTTSGTYTAATAADHDLVAFYR